MPSPTLVIQSHTDPLPYPWLAECLASVRAWSVACGFDYRFLGDELFAPLDGAFAPLIETQPVVAADVGRLHHLALALADYQRVVWVDADVLVFEPERLVLPDVDHAFGREVWIQHSPRGRGRAPRLAAHVKIHNAFMMFGRGNSVLEFYRYAAERMVRAHLRGGGGPLPPQFVGPKLLAVLHNVLQFPVVETAAMLCPLVLRDLIADAGDVTAGAASGADEARTGRPGRALALFAQKMIEPPAAANLCGSMRAAGEVSDGDVEAAIRRLRGSHPFD